MAQQQVNDNLVLLCGKSAAGKSAALRDIKNPEGVIYLNCESGKKLPFRSQFKQLTITDPHQVPQAFAEAENMPDVHTIVVDSLTYMMDMYESLFVLTSANGMKAWSDFAQFFKNLMQQSVANSTKNVVFIAHTVDAYNESEMVMDTKVPVKGALKNQGIESYFSCVIAAKKMKIKDLKDYGSAMLTFTPKEEALGFKYVFQTDLTKDTVNERLRGPMGLFDTKETYIDNNIQLVFDRLHHYYEG